MRHFICILVLVFLAEPVWAGDFSKHLERIKLYEKSGEYRLVIREYTDLIENHLDEAKNPESLYLDRGEAWHDQGNYDKAIADYNEAIRIDPTSVDAYLDRGEAWNDKGNYDKAIADYNEAIRIDPTSVDAWNSLAWFRATCPDANYRNGKEALRNATKACKLDGWNNPDFIDTLAAAHAEAGNFEEAIKRSQQAIELAPEKEEEGLRSRLELYRAGKPYREEPVETEEE